MILVGLAWHEAYSFSIWHMPEIKKILTFYDHNFILLGITSLHCGNKAGFRFHASKRPHLMTADYRSVAVKLRILSCPYLQKTGQLRSLNIKEFKNVPIITMGKLCTKGQLSYIKAIYDYCPSRIHVGGHHSLIHSLCSNRQKWMWIILYWGVGIRSKFRIVLGWGSKVEIWARFRSVMVGIVTLHHVVLLAFTNKNIVNGSLEDTLLCRFDMMSKKNMAVTQGRVFLSSKKRPDLN